MYIKIYLLLTIVFTTSIFSQQTYQPNWESIDKEKIRNGLAMPNLEYLFTGDYTPSWLH